MKYKEIISLINSGSFSAKGKSFGLTGTITAKEVEFFKKLITKEMKVMDIGVGKGVSTALFSSICKENVYGIDPFQTIEHLKSCEILCETLEIKKPVIIEKRTIECFNEPILENVKFDFIFVDGYHTFDATLLDFLILEDKLKDGGMIAFHDCYYRSKQKAINFILKNRDYEMLEDTVEPNLGIVSRIARSLYHALFKYKTNLALTFKLLKPHRTDSSLVILRKKSDYKPFYNEYFDF